LQMRLLYPALLLLLSLLICSTDAAPKAMIRTGGRLDRIQEQTMDSWTESLNKHRHRHHHHPHQQHRRHRLKRRHHHKKKREEKDVDSILLDLDKIMRPRFG
ncbi:hypothetical protein PMAYCL1PPCAC_31171, partial [Pristionchus mayeri]